MTISEFVRWFGARVQQHTLVRGYAKAFDLNVAGELALPCVVLEADMAGTEVHGPGGNTPGLSDWQVAFNVLDQIDPEKTDDPNGDAGTDKLEALQRIGDAIISQIRNSPLHHFRPGSLSRVPILGTGSDAGLSGWRYEFQVRCQDFPRDAYSDQQFDPSWVALEPGSTPETPYPALTASQGLRRVGNDVQVKFGAGLAVDDTGALTVTGDTGGPGQDGEDGADGVGIASVTQPTSTTLLVTLTDNTTQGPFTLPAGQDGQDGADGVSVGSITEPITGTMRVTLSNGAFSDFALPAGPQGEQGVAPTVVASTLEAITIDLYVYKSVTLDGTIAVAFQSGDFVRFSWSKDVSLFFTAYVTDYDAESRTLSFYADAASLTGETLEGWNIALTGQRGEPGPQGQAATIYVNSVTTGAAGSAASVTNVGNEQEAYLDFVIPRGATGRGFNPRGAWTAFTGYAQDDIVTYQGNTYRRAVAGTSGGTFNAANWELWAQKGDTGATGPSGSSGLDYGDGSDGDVTLSVASTTLTRSMYYNNLTIADGCILNAGGWKIFVKGTLTIGSGAIIHRNGNSGGNSTGTGAGTAGAIVNAGDVGGASAGGNGAAGSTGVGAAAGATTAAVGMGGNTSNSGQGGAGASGIGGVASGSLTTTLRPVRNVTTHLIFGNTLVSGGTSSRGGASGAGDGTNSGGGGGGGASAGGVVGIWAATIVNNGSIQALGGNGGNGGSPTAGNCGGGGGAGGAGGGWVYIVCNSYSGAGTITCAGGTGGTGGTKTGTGTNGGNGGNGGAGRWAYYQASTNSWTYGQS